MLPSLYISHGSPELMIQDNKTTKFLKNLSSKFDEPKYILVISAHWVSNDLKILYDDTPFLINDFYGFSDKLYNIKYPVKSCKKRCNEIISLLESNNIEIKKDESRGGFDHGVWSPLTFLYPDANIKVLQISLPKNYDAKELYKLGEVLSVLRDDTLIISSGSLTHNLMDLNWRSEDDKNIKTYAKSFRDWIVENIEKESTNSLLEYKTQAPYLKQNHPTLEHFLPLFVTLGSAKGTKGKSLHDVFMYGNLSMETIIFEK